VAKVGIIVNLTKDHGLAMTKSIISWLENKNAAVLLSEDTSSMILREDLGFSEEYIYKNADFVIVLGGDGTLLGTARQVLWNETPILGINMGHLGFITEVETDDVFSCLEKVIRGDYSIESRMMLEADVVKNNTLTKTLYCLNDFGLTRGTLSRMVQLKTYIGGNFLSTYNADGLLISTPTGSTAYSLSAGGPIISPNVNVMLITPICPHSLNSRAIVVGDNEVIRVDIEENYQDVYITGDGQQGYPLKNGDSILIKKAPFALKLIKVSERSYYDILRTKLKER
jgi:NAD+ kinase